MTFLHLGGPIYFEFIHLAKDFDRSGARVGAQVTHNGAVGAVLPLLAPV
jgi:hypothetical protein